MPTRSVSLVRLKRLWSDLVRFTGRDLWERNLDEFGVLGRSAITMLRVGAVVKRGFAQHELSTRAGALTYVSIFSLIPTLAVAFAMFNAFGGLTHAKSRLFTHLMNYLAVGVHGTATEQVNQILQHVNNGAIGATGFVFVVIAVFTLLSSIEDVFNNIWGVTRSRTYFERLTVYWTAVTVSPTLVVLGMSLPAILRRLTPLHWIIQQTGTGDVVFNFLFPWMFVVIGFAMLYWFIISKQIPLTAALIGGVSGGTLWFVAVHAYAWYIRSTVYYANLYGSLAAIPILIFWIYLSWSIVFIGAQVAFASQELDTYREEILSSDISQTARELVALRIVAECARRFIAGDQLPTTDDLTRTLQTSGRLVNELASQLVARGILLEFGSDQRLAPSRDPRHLTPVNIIHHMRDYGTMGAWHQKDDTTQELEVLQRRAIDASDAAWEDMTFADLLRDQSPRDGRSARDPQTVPSARRRSGDRESP
jgi:membrane protein